VLRNVRVEVGDGTAIPDAVVVVREGRIVAAGPAAGTEVPAGLPSEDGAGGTLLPAFVHAASRLGLPGGGGAPGKPTPSESVAEEFDPAHRSLRAAARAGVAILGLLPGPGAPGGEGLPVRTAGDGGAAILEGGRLLRVDVEPTTAWAKGLSGALENAKREVEAEERAAKEAAAHRVALAEWEARKADLERKGKEAEEAHAKEKAAAEKEGKPAPKPPEKGDPGKPPEAPKPFVPEPRTRILREALRRTAAVVVVVNSAADAERALDLLAPFRLRLAFRCSGDAWRAAARMAGAEAAAILEPEIRNAPGSLDRVNPAAVLAAAGCPVALLPTSENRRAWGALPVEAGLLVKAGLPRKEAIRSLALEGARILGVDGTAGTVAAGRSADLLLYDGDPLEGTTRLRRVWIAGAEQERPGEERP
jgi:hypothetical protein